ncbi:MAG TPA: type II toxin-antitoxin system RelB/DinJ family antitoxin [Gammaproteobacteria bacterium]|jgi:DNA-damage-inducible protein J|nr:type II toxin-antitoxin system RelB/DinJ family antitoxin [Gammaproteobacteria bacterium]
MKRASSITHMKDSFVHSRIDKNDKARVSFILDEIGLNVSDAIRLFLKQVIIRKGLPFSVCIPNAQTIAAMESAEKGEDLEPVTLEQLHSQFQAYRKKPVKALKKKRSSKK